MRCDGVLGNTRFQSGLVFKAHKLLYHSNLGLRGIKTKEKNTILRLMPESWRPPGLARPYWIKRAACSAAARERQQVTSPWT